MWIGGSSSLFETSPPLAANFLFRLLFVSRLSQLVGRGPAPPAFVSLRAVGRCRRRMAAALSHRLSHSHWPRLAGEGSSAIASCFFFFNFSPEEKDLLAKEARSPPGNFQGLRQLLGRSWEWRQTRWILAHRILIGLSVRDGRFIGSRKPWFDPCWWDGFRRLPRQGVPIAEGHSKISRGWGQVRMEASVEAGARLFPLIQKSDVSNSSALVRPQAQPCSHAQIIRRAMRRR